MELIWLLENASEERQHFNLHKRIFFNVSSVEGLSAPQQLNEWYDATRSYQSSVNTNFKLYLILQCITHNFKLHKLLIIIVEKLYVFENKIWMISIFVSVYSYFFWGAIYKPQFTLKRKEVLSSMTQGPLSIRKDPSKIYEFFIIRCNWSIFV